MMNESQTKNWTNFILMLWIFNIIFQISLLQEENGHVSSEAIPSLLAKPGGKKNNLEENFKYIF